MGILVAQTTKRALEASLKKLLLRKPLNKITINDITEDCGVNRMTFYYHFKDIYDLVDWILVEDATGIRTTCGKSPSRDHSLRVSSSRFWVKQGRQCAMNQSASGQCIPSSASRC